MSEPAKAVFLSYASQDTEAARRICEALRAAGVEVWFDQSELRGGDAWDQKIRRQIKECALFVPVISDNTNARAEGYFRLEWKLAVDRSHLMADDAPFLFPVVIGDVKDAAARVPEKFREVQWTRLRLDETPAELSARVARLLGGNAGASPDDARGRRHAAPLQESSPRWRWWMILPIVGTVMGLLFAAMPLWRAMQDRPARPAAPLAVTVSVPPAAPVPSEARQLTLRARALLDKIDSTADDFAVAESLAKRAIELDPTDGEAWAVSSRINSAYLNRNFERNDVRREAARSQAERAVKLAPDSPEAWLALGRGVQGADLARSEEAIRQGLKLAPNDGRLLLALAGSYRRQNRFDEAFAVYEQAAAQPDARALARYDQYLIHFYFRRFAEADRCIREAIAVVPTTNMVAGLAMLEVTWRGQVAEAHRLMAEVPTGVRGQPRVVLTTALVALMASEPIEALRALDRLPADYINDAWFTGPKGLLTGLAHAQAGSREAARLAWESGLAVAKRRLQEAPNDPESHLRHGELLGWLGQTEAALQEARVFDELRRGRNSDWTYSAARIHAAIGRADLAVPLLAQLLEAPPSSRWPLTPALLRVDPLWEKLRGDAGFQKLAASDRPATPAALAVNDKSVAVLAFANLSDDKANEYFSDGISEELLNVLAKVPGLKVSARTSAFFFKGKDVPIPEIAQKLGVAYVVEGSVRKAGDKVRITAQLIKAADGFHVWSDTFTRDLKDIFAVQDEIAGLIAKNLSLQMGIGGRVARPVNPEAYRLYLEGRHLWGLRSIDSFDRAEVAFKQAVALEPDSALMRAGLAELYATRAWYRSLAGKPQGDDFNLGAAEAKRALALDPDNAQVYAAPATIALFRRQFAEAERLLQKSLALAPNDAAMIDRYGDLMVRMGRLDAALEHYRRAVQLDPLSRFIVRDVVRTSLYARRYDDCIDTARRFEAAGGQDMALTIWKVAALTKLGRTTEVATALQPMLPKILSGDMLPSTPATACEAVKYLRDAGFVAESDALAKRLLGQTGAESYLNAILLAACGLHEEAIASLEEFPAGSEDRLFWSSVFDPIRDDPRFQRKVAGLPNAEQYSVARATLARMTSTGGAEEK